MFCPDCGTKAEDGSVFCENCGASLFDGASASVAPMPSSPPSANEPVMAPPAQPMQQMPIQKKSKAPLIIVVVVLVLVIAGIAIAFALGGGDDKKASSGAIEHQVVFETYGGSQYKDATFKTGTIIDTPNNPSRAGSTFEGWFADATFTEPVAFPYTIDVEDPETITFYAKWSENASASVATGSMDYMSDTTSVLPLSSTTYLTEADLRLLTADQLQRAINEIYARNGYIFQQSITEKQYFESRPWYRGTELNQDVVKARFNQFEDANVRLLQSYRDSHF